MERGGFNIPEQFFTAVKTRLAFIAFKWFHLKKMSCVFLWDEIV